MPGSRQFARRIAALTAGALVVAGCATGPSATAPTVASAGTAVGGSPTTGSVQPDLARFYDQQVAWKNCGPAECGTVTVPLDYDDPTGATIELAITRVPARGERIGSLFVDPGGPGGSAVDYAKAADLIVSPAVRDRFDIVGVDPRGVGGSTPVHCLTDEQTDALLELDAVPDTPAEQDAVAREAANLGRLCAQKAGAVLGHVGTADAARDLDIARAVVGDSTLNYLGKSYGSQLGAVYAELFPHRVGRMVLDGVLPASLDIVEVTKGQAEAFEYALRDFVATCLESAGCPLSGSVDDGVAQVQSWLASLPDAPTSDGTRELTRTLATNAVVSNLYFPDYDYPRLRGALTAAMNEQNPATMLAILDDRISRGPDGRYLDNSTDAFYAVTCLDRPFSGSVDEVRRIAESWRASAPTFGPALAWGLLTCRDWPVVEAAPVTSTLAAGSNPILVVSTTHDPATPYQWGELVTGQLANAHLLTRDGVGHTGYLEGSSCTDDAVDAYLLRGEIPEDGVRCT